MGDIFDHLPNLLQECTQQPDCLEFVKERLMHTENASNMAPKTTIKNTSKTVQFVKHSPLAQVPIRQNPGDVGYDLCATHRATVPPLISLLKGDFWDDSRDTLEIKHTHVTSISTGLSIKFPPGYYGEIVPRSGLSFIHGIVVINSPGIIDNGFRGIIQVGLVNLSGEPFYVEPGNRIAQLLIKNYEDFTFQETTELDETQRGDKGFGSTGK